MKHKTKYIHVFPTAMFWAGWNDHKDEGTFAHALSGKELRKEDGYWPWYPGEPNGGVLENCAVVWAIRDGWNDFMCFEKAFGYCLIQPRPTLILRGLKNLCHTQVISNSL